jgi:ABC-type Na+ transport system ATPase subunit NatA
MLPVEVLAQVRENIKLAETQIKDAEKAVVDARIAGIDVTEQSKELESLKQQVRQMKAVYGR